MVEVHLPVAAYACLLGDAQGGLGEKLMGDGNLLMRHELRLQSAYGQLAVLAGLNRLYWPGGKRIDRLIARMSLAPVNLWARLQAVFSDPLPSLGISCAAEDLDALWNEAYALIECFMPDVVPNVVTPPRSQFAEI